MDGMQLVSEWRESHFLSVCLGEEGVLREALRWGGRNEGLLQEGVEFSAERSLEVAVMVGNILEQTRERTLCGFAVRSDCDGVLAGLEREESVGGCSIEFVLGRGVRVGGVMYEPGFSISPDLLVEAFPSSTQLDVVEVDIARLWSERLGGLVRLLLRANRRGWPVRVLAAT